MLQLQILKSSQRLSHRFNKRKKILQKNSSNNTFYYSILLQIILVYIDMVITKRGVQYSKFIQSGWTDPALDDDKLETILVKSKSIPSKTI